MVLLLVIKIVIIIYYLLQLHRLLSLTEQWRKSWRITILLALYQWTYLRPLIPYPMT